MSAGLACLADTAEVQGLIIDRDCADTFLKLGIEKTLKQDRNCSLMRNGYARSGYGVLTDNKHFYRFDDAGNKLALRLLHNTPDKDNLKVIVKGDIQGDTIHVTDMSML